MNIRDEYISLGFGTKAVAFTLGLKIPYIKFVFEVNKALYLQDVVSTASLAWDSLSLDGCNTLCSYPKELI